MLALGPRLRAFVRSRRGTSALEFALVSPMLILLLLGAFELARAVNTTRKLTNLSASISNMLAENTTGSVNQTDILFLLDSTMVTFPPVLPDSKAQGMNWWNDITVSMSSIGFTPTQAGCTVGCTYNAQVYWSSGNRPCNVNLAAVDDAAASSPATLPADVFGPGSIVVVDVQYKYRPIVAANWFGPITLTRSAYAHPRYVPVVGYDWSQGWVATVC